MQYQKLQNIYYKDEKIYLQEYEQRFQALFTKHFDFDIKQFNHRHAYPAFLCYTEELVVLLEKIYVENQKLLVLLNKTPDVVLKQFCLLCIIDEVKASNDIEGNHSTRRELREAMENISNKNRFVSTMNKYKMLLSENEINFSSAKAVRAFYDEFAHKEVIEDNPSNELDGEIFRRNPVDIDSGTGKTIHRGIYLEEKVIGYMETALEVFNAHDIPVLIKNAVFHYMFAYIHPFYDGNGRTARFMASYGMSKNLHYTVCLRLSAAVKKNTKKYYKMFANADAELNRGDLTPFVIEFLEFVYQAVRDTQRLLERKLKQFVANVKVLKDITNDDITSKMYVLLFQASILYGQGLTVAQLEKQLGKSRNTIMARFSKIPKEHIIVNTVKKTNYYKLNLLLFRQQKS